MSDGDRTPVFRKKSGDEISDIRRDSRTARSHRPRGDSYESSSRRERGSVRSDSPRTRSPESSRYRYEDGHRDRRESDNSTSRHRVKEYPRPRSRNGEFHNDRAEEFRREDRDETPERHRERRDSDRRHRERKDDDDRHSRHRSRDRSEGRKEHHRHHRTRSRSSDKTSSGEASSDSEARRRRKKRRSRRSEDKDVSSHWDQSHKSTAKRKRYRSSREEREKRKKDKNEKASGISKSTWGRHGIIFESSMSSKQSELRTWLIEERRLNPETLSRDRLRKETLTFIEDYNTSSFTHEKFYDLEKYKIKIDMIRSGETLPLDEGTYDPTADLKAHSSRVKAERQREKKLSREEVEELRQVEKERIEIGRMRLLGMDVDRNLGVRTDYIKREEMVFDDKPFP